MGGVDACAIDIVEQNYAAGTDMVNDVVADESGVFILPIPWVYGPEDNLLVEGSSSGIDVAIDAAVGRAEETDKLAREGLDGVSGGREVVEDGGVRETGEIAMNPGVAANIVSFARCADDLASEGIDAVAEYKKGGFGMSIGQDIKESIGVFAGTVVEGESETFGDGAVNVVGVFIGKGVDAEHGFGEFEIETALQVGEFNALLGTVQAGD